MHVDVVVLENVAHQKVCRFLDHAYRWTVCVLRVWLVAYHSGKCTCEPPITPLDTASPNGMPHNGMLIQQQLTSGTRIAAGNQQMVWIPLSLTTAAQELSQLGTKPVVTGRVTVL